MTISTCTPMKYYRLKPPEKNIVLAPSTSRFKQMLRDQ